MVVTSHNMRGETEIYVTEYISGNMLQRRSQSYTFPSFSRSRALICLLTISPSVTVVAMVVVVLVVVVLVVDEGCFCDTLAGK